MLHIDQITKSFGNRQVLDDLSLTIKRGRIYSIMGPNGAGKTTLFNIITGFIRPDTGSVIFEDSDITSLAPHRIHHRGISRTFQDLRFVKNLTVIENVILSLQDRQQGSIVAGIMPRMRGLRLVGEKKRQESHEILRQFRISHLADRPAGEISYGEQKLLSIACCIGLAPRLLLIDEPVAGINPELRLQMAQLLKDLRGSGYTIVLIEHNTDFIESISDRFIFANEGRAVEYSSFKVMIQDPTVLESYLV